MAFDFKKLVYVIQHGFGESIMDYQNAREDSLKLLEFFDPSNWHALENRLKPTEIDWMHSLEDTLGIVNGYIEETIIKNGKVWRICWWKLEIEKINDLYKKLKEKEDIIPEENIYAKLPEQVWQRTTLSP